MATVTDLTALYTAWKETDPTDEAAMADRTERTRELAAVLMAVDIATAGARTQLGDLIIAEAGWSRGAEITAELAGHPGSGPWREALGTHDRVVLTADGKFANTTRWCNDRPEHVTWIQYERWTPQGRDGHGFVCAYCRGLVQTG